MRPSDQSPSPEAPSPDKRSPRCERILRTALAEFAEKGYAQTDVQVIADAAGVGKGTVYRALGNKKALFLAAVRFARERLREEVDRQAAAVSDPLERLRTAMLACLRYCDEHPEIVEILIQERAHFPGRTLTFFDRPAEEVNLWSERLRELVELRIFRDLPIPRIHDAISKFVLGAMFVNFFAGRARSLAEPYEEMVDVLFRGLLAREGTDENTSIPDRDDVRVVERPDV